MLNSYKCEKIIYAKEADITIRYIKFQNKYYLLGKYRLVGVCEKGCIDQWRYCRVWGNPVLKTQYHGTDTEYWQDETGRRWNDWPKEKFSQDTVESYCWIVIEKYSEAEFHENELKELKEEQLVVLMRDIPGEAG